MPLRQVGKPRQSRTYAGARRAPRRQSLPQTGCPDLGLGLLPGGVSSLQVRAEFLRPGIPLGGGLALAVVCPVGQGQVKPICIPARQHILRRLLPQAGGRQQVCGAHGGTWQRMATLQERLVHQRIGGQPIKIASKPLARAVRHRGLSRTMAQRHMQHMMRQQTDLFGQGQGLELCAVEDDIMGGPRRPCPVAVRAPQRQDGDGRVDLGQPCQGATRPAAMGAGAGQSSPMSARTRAYSA
jgi:hypothetical protein